MKTRRQFIRSAALGSAILSAGLGSSLLAAPDSREDPEPKSNEPSNSAPPPEALNQSIIDWHNHWIAPGVVKLLSQRTSPPGLVIGPDGAKFPLEKNGPAAKPQDPIWFDAGLRLRHLDQVGIQRQIVSFVGPAYDGLLPPEEARPFWRAQNDGLAELVRRHPNRFSGLATLPTARVDWAAEELERAHRELGLIGATLPLDAFISLEGARSLAPIFRVAQKYGSHIYIHRGPSGRQVPGQQPEVGPANAWFGLASYDGPNSAPPSPPGDSAYARATLLTSSHLATGAITLSLTDFLDPYPDVSVQLTMIGGSISFVAEQIEIAAERSGKPNPREKLRRIYLDTGASGRGPRGIALAAKVFGADRILFGTDYGPWPSTVSFIAAVNRAEVSPEEKHLIYLENGRKLLAKYSIAA
jgi:predicted TIM-barrel fold metal-dependent hydrolase